MNIHESYVSLETAKLLKQAGFDWETEFGQHILDRDIRLEHNINFNSQKYLVSLPTLEVAQRWLREVKKYHIYVRPYSLDDETYVTNIVITDSRWGSLQDDNKKAIIFKTYEEALDAGIKKALEIILEKGE